MPRKIDFKALVNRADPRHQQESNYPVEYEFSNERKFRGYYKKRGAYAPDEGEES